MPRLFALLLELVPIEAYGVVNEGISLLEDCEEEDDNDDVEDHSLMVLSAEVVAMV